MGIYFFASNNDFYNIIGPCESLNCLYVQKFMFEDLSFFSWLHGIMDMKYLLFLIFE